MSIGTKVRKYREAKNWSQEDLAMRLDTTQTTISNIESDKNIPNSLLLNKLAKELDINMNELFDDKITNINQIEKIEGAVNLGNGTINMQSPELIESILKNQEQITKLIELQSRLIENLLKK
ncbi:XRE family transcriptional regulator [Chryseobacterium carnipullorum]|uniref:Transcriptional repressor DicA n=1 Tax=Chryseobacterium carnipullorum TaxID=1124835 RepID=A0A376DP72_CHRCU|nr:helix-turn-helix transcriptional regulator [Chryseobacterium carnipullorum]AZA48674.1 XRE family transcriptional regulator [Chryseobacterium carnipullorum]AZA63588.1 XRE family transcriptional regulator [Chryseobacterium carnipullorum]STC92894.1 transcriptional repressor DicA [Chryseobacterium carnipullorum]